MAEKIYQNTPDGRVELTEEKATAYITWRDKESKRLADTKWLRGRQAEYPSIVDVTVALAEKTEGDSTMWDEITTKRAAVKTKWPKDNSGPV